MAWSQKAKENRRGNGNPNWKGGISLDRKKYEKSYWSKNKKRRKEIVKKCRDNSERKLKYHLKRKERYNTPEFKAIQRINRFKRRSREGSISITKEQLKDFVSKSRYCPYCKCILNKKYIEIDHKIPLSRGGQNKLENLVVCCRSCNRRKGAMTDKEFLQKH